MRLFFDRGTRTTLTLCQREGVDPRKADGGGSDVCAFLLGWSALEIACSHESGTGLLLCPRGTFGLRANLVTLGQRPCQAVQGPGVGRDHISRILDLANNASAFVFACLAHAAVGLMGSHLIQGKQESLNGDEGRFQFC